MPPHLFSSKPSNSESSLSRANILFSCKSIGQKPSCLFSNTEFPSDLYSISYCYLLTLIGFKMKRSLMAALVMIFFLFVAGRCCSARLLERDLFIAPGNPPAFVTNLNSVSEGQVEKDAMQYDQENSPWIISSAPFSKNSVKGINKLLFRLSPTIQNINKASKSPVWSEDEGVLNLMPKGRPSLNVNLMEMTEQRLPKSRHSPGVGHMQMTRHKSQTRNVDIHDSTGDDKRKKRKLGFQPSPGDGH